MTLSTFPKHIFCMDVDYRKDDAFAAGILFKEWESVETVQTTTAKIQDVQPYESGQFYKRELPCLIQLIDQLEHLPSMFIVDGFVYLDAHQKLGLGGYLWEYYDRQVPVIGVAKKSFKGNTASIELLRGLSQTPLFITSAGLDSPDATKMIQKMHGEFRLPTLLKKVDQLCRSTADS